MFLGTWADTCYSTCEFIPQVFGLRQGNSYFFNLGYCTIEIFSTFTKYSSHVLHVDAAEGGGGSCKQQSAVMFWVSKIYGCFDRHFLEQFRAPTMGFHTYAQIEF